MEELELTQLISGYRERVRRIALFDPLYDLDRKQKTDGNGTRIDMKGLGLLTLLFFFEQKLMRNTKTGVKELAYFLKESTKRVYFLKDEAYEELARTIIQTFRPTHGQKTKLFVF